MIIFLILGLLLGGVTVLFFFQNIDPVSVSFLWWSLDGSLAIILMIAFGSGVLVTLLFLLPTFIRDEWQYRKLRKRAAALETELAAKRPSNSVFTPPPQQSHPAQPAMTPFTPPTPSAPPNPSA